jgi:hypothetical protein
LFIGERGLFRCRHSENVRFGGAKSSTTGIN